MLKRLRFMAIIAALLLAGWVVLYLTGPKEPTYEGKKLTDWLTRYEADSVSAHGANYERAIRAIGTNGIPTLLLLLTAKDLGFKNYHLFDAEYRYRLASLGFQTLGKEAKPATPELIRLAKSGAQPGIRKYALWCLEETKPEKEILVRVLAQSTNDVDPQVAQFAAERLYNRQHNLAYPE